MDHFWKTIGLLGLELLDICHSHPLELPYHKDVAVGEVPAALLAIALLLVSVVCLVACVCCRENQRKGFKEFRDSTHSVQHVGLSFTNPGLSPCSELAIFPPPGVGPVPTPAVTFEPLPHPATLSPVTVHATKRPAYRNISVNTLSDADWFESGNSDFPRDQLQYLQEYGRGWFGRVVEGEARGPADTRQKVMVRMLREDATPAEQRYFLNEAKPFRDLKHPNVLRMVGRCLETNPYLVLLEACSGGDLKTFLCSNMASCNVLCEQGVCLRIMCQVATGLQHMISHGFIHTDLAARNCLVTSDLTVKVGDYGTSIETYKDDYYIAGDVAVPIRWCAPETLHCTDTTIETKQVTAEANVWSLGVLLWEICQFGQMPYTELTDDQVIVRVLGGEGLRLPPPTIHSLHANALYNLMGRCWQPTDRRGSLDHVLSMLNHLHSSHSEEDFQRRWDALRPNSTPELNLETMTAKSDFDSGVDLEIKSSDREVLDLVKKSSSDVNMSPSTASPQLSVASSSGGEFFSQSSLSVLNKQLSPSLTNLRGSVEDVSKSVKKEKAMNMSSETEEFDSWLKGVETKTDEDVKFVKKISEAIKDLDDALALEKTSSSSDDSSRHESPLKDTNTQDENPILDFRLGPQNQVREQINVQPDSLLNDSLARRDSSGTDTEEETWRGRIERGEFSEKVKEKSKSVTDLMILTHIESESSESDSLPSLTRQYSIEKNKRKPSGAMMSTIGFGSEGNIRGAVLGETFQDALKQLQAEWKLRDPESRESSLQFIKSENHSAQYHDELDFLSNDASEKIKPQVELVTRNPVSELQTAVLSHSSVMTDPVLQNNALQGKAAPSPSKTDVLLDKSDISSTHACHAFETESKLSDGHENIQKSIKFSPETIDGSDASQITESSSEMSTPTQCEVFSVQSFLDSEKEHSSCLKMGLIETKPVLPAKIEHCVGDLIMDLPSMDKSLEVIEKREIGSEFPKPEIESVKIVPKCKDIDNQQYVEIHQTKTVCDKINNPLNSPLILNKEFVMNNEGISSVEHVESNVIDLDETLTQLNDISNELLIKSATHKDSTVLTEQSVGKSFSSTSSDDELVNKSCSGLNSIEDNIPLKTPEFLLTRVENKGFVPEIVVTEASILDLESDSEPELVLPNVSRTRRSVRIIMSDSDESEDDEELLGNATVFNSSNFASNEICSSTPFVMERNIVPENTISDVDLTFPESEKSEPFVVPLSKEKNPKANEESSVILGSCEDYTLDYFKGLKTTFGKQTSDESTDEFSKSEGEDDEKKQVSINNWDDYLTSSHQQQYEHSDVEFETSDTDFELNDKNKDNIESSNHFSDNLKTHFNDDMRKNIVICDRMSIYDSFSGKKNYEDHDQQLQEVKSRLEDVAMLSQSFCLKNQNISMDDDEDGKLLTPDDERSSDSGFRDKGSLSESVEDACDEKYNLEDIDAELEEQYGKHPDGRSGEDLQDDKSEVKEDSSSSKESEEDRGCDSTYVICRDGETESDLTISTTKASESSSESVEAPFVPADSLGKQERLNKLDNALNSNIDLYFDPQPKTGWYLHPPPGNTVVDPQPVNSGWLPSAPEEGKDSSYVSFEIDEEFVTAIRNELREKLPCAQNAERTNVEEDISPEEERMDMIIQYNTFPAPLSPIIEERESLSSNQSSLLLDDAGKSIESSGRLSPVLYVDTSRGDDNLFKFEDEIRNVLDVCNSESTDSENVLVTVEDLEHTREGKAQKQKIMENSKAELDDFLIVDMETNKVTMYESPKPHSQLAFIRQVVEPADDNSSVNSESCTFYHSADDNLLSVDRNNLTYTPDSVSPISTGSSRTGVAVSFSSSETGGNLSGFYLSPSSVRSDLFDNGPPSLPFDLGHTYDLVEEIKPNNEAEEIVQELVEAGMVKKSDLTREVGFSVEGINCGIVSSKDTSRETSEVVESQTTEDEKGENESLLKSSVVSEISETSESKKLSVETKGNLNSNNLNLCHNSPERTPVTSCDKIDELLVSESKGNESFQESDFKTKSSDSGWLKSVLLSDCKAETDLSGTAKGDASSICLNSNGWPSAEELISQSIPAVKCESHVVVTTPESPCMDLLEVAAKFNDVNSTLAISTPNNMSFDESKDNSQVSSFTSTPTLETVKCITVLSKFPEKVMQSEQNSIMKETGSRMKSIPTLSNLASEIVLQLPVPDDHKDVISQDSSPDDSERAKILQGMTLALEPSVISKAPMPSPEDADKGAWRPTMGQLMELTSQPEQDDMMTTSFIDTDNNDYAPDWESDSSDDSEDHSSSSGEFIWRDGDREAAVRVVIASDDLKPQEGASMPRITEEDEEGEDNSSCGSTTEFIPSVWDSSATPSKPALRSPDSKKSEKRNVCFKRQKYHCVYEYPREPSDSEDDEDLKILQRRSWQTPQTFDYSTYADWEYGEGEVEEAESDSDDNAGPRQLPDSEYDIYRLSNLDFDMMTQMNLDDGEFFISSSARPFHMGDSSQFFPGSLSEDDFLVEFKPCASDTDAVVIQSPDQLSLDDTVSVELCEVVKPEVAMKEVKEKQKPTDLYIVAEPVSENASSAEVSPTLGELRHTRQKLKLDLGGGGVRGEASLLDSGGEDSGVESTATGSSDRLDQVQSSEA